MPLFGGHTVMYGEKMLAPQIARLQAYVTGMAEGRAKTSEIATLCAQAGRPELLCTFLFDGLSADEVRVALALIERPN